MPTLESAVDKARADWFRGEIGRTYKSSKPDWRRPPEVPKGAPNIVLIVLDDVGFSDLGCYGSEIGTPAMDALAEGGIRYRNFHVTAMCSPTRASLLSGRNSHSTGVGIIAEWSNGYPGYEGRMSHQAAIVPEVLGQHGYACHAVGKWHLTNMEHYSAAGPHSDWPCGRGFDTWYGFHGALADHWNPELYDDNHPINVATDDGYHLSEDLVGRAMDRIRDHTVSAPDRPFFLYLGFGACHWPHHAPRPYIEKYDGVYDKGWDAIRQERFEKQRALGIIPKSAQLAPRNPGVDAWEDVDPDTRKLAVRLQQAYAGFLEHTDDQIGRLISYLEEMGLRDDTLVILLSDNGASPEGGKTGALNLRKHMVYEFESPEVGLAAFDKLGSEHAYNHYPTGWAQVSNTPLKWYKKDAHEGGIRAPIIFNWPGKLGAENAVRTQYHHVTDVAPTIYDIVGVSLPETHNGLPQVSMHGVSMTYTFADAEASTTRQVQHYEILGDRAIWKSGLKAVARHVKGEEFDDDRWELYDTDSDFSETRDLADERPEELKRMVDLWWSEAERYGALPLDDREWERAAERMRMNPRTRYIFHQNMARIDRLLAPDVTGRDFGITVDLAEATREDHGTLLAWGSRFGGLSLHLEDGQFRAIYRYSESEPFIFEAELPEGRIASVAFAFERDGENSGGIASLFCNGKDLTRGRIAKTWPTHGLTAGLTCGIDAGAPIIDDRPNGFRFSGRICRVVLNVGDGTQDDGPLLSALLAEE